MSETHQIDYLLTINAEMSYRDLRRLEMSLIRCLNFAESLTGDPNLKRGIRTVNQAIMALRMLQITIRTTQALIAGTLGGPIGWLYAGTQLLATGMNIGSVVLDNMAIDTSYDSSRGYS